MMKTKKTRRPNKIILIGLLLFSIVSHASPFTPDETLYGFESFLESQGIEKIYTPEEMKKLLTLSEELLVKNPLKWDENQLAFLKFSIRQASERGDAEEATKRFNLAKHILYMLYAQVAIDQKDQQEHQRFSHLKKNTSKQMRFALRLLNKRKIFRVKVGSVQAIREAGNLADPQDSQKVLTAKALEKLSAKEIGELDIQADHPMWHRKDYLQNHPDLWHENEESLNRLGHEYLSKKYPDYREGRQANYDLRKDHLVVFFDDIKISGTSPKITVKDSLGLKWKMKWGAEIQPEVISSRLYMALGGKFIDPVYATANGSEGITLILNPQSSQGPQISRNSQNSQKRCSPITAEDLIKCLRNSHYQFDLKPYVHSTGLITPENLHEVFHQQRAGALGKYQAKKMIGRHFVTFKESLMEFSSQEIIKRGGPITWTNFDSLSDRVKRGLLLFNSWINNPDPKEDNSKGYLIPTLAGQTFIMAQHDLGNSLKGYISPGNINEFSTMDFIFREKDALYFNYFLIYLPGAWKKASYSDLYWMAEKIVQLGKPQLEAIVKYSQWPDFMQKAVVYKLLMRRNRIAEIFHLDHLLIDEVAIDPPSQSLPLSTSEERKVVATHYHLDGETLERDFKNFSLGEQHEQYEDNILHKGRIALCESTFLMRRMHRESYPTGLDRRVLNRKILSKIPHSMKECGGLHRLNLNRFINSL